jgi:hypothetical protein
VPGVRAAAASLSRGLWPLPWDPAAEPGGDTSGTMLVAKPPEAAAVEGLRGPTPVAGVEALRSQLPSAGHVDGVVRLPGGKLRFDSARHARCRLVAPPPPPHTHTPRGARPLAARRACAAGSGWSVRCPGSLLDQPRAGGPPAPRR